MSRLIADIGATNARFAIANDAGIEHIDVLPCDDFPTLADAAQAYLSRVGGVKPQTGAFAVAIPLSGADEVSMTNHGWSFSISGTRKALGFDKLDVINDFTALALGITHLTAADYYKVGGGESAQGAPIGIIGPGTGLGVGAVVFGRDGAPVPVTTEGGHVTMPASNEREFRLFEWLKQTKYHHISAERVISGKGLVNIYHGLCGLDGLSLPEKTPAEITEAALARSCPVCVETLDLFCHFLGVAAGNVALTYGAFGGIYIAGGIVPRLGSYFATSRFMQSFLEKGRFKDYLAPIPVRVITHPYPGLEGLKYLD